MAAHDTAAECVEEDSARRAGRKDVEFASAASRAGAWRKDDGGGYARHYANLVPHGHAGTPSSVTAPSCMKVRGLQQNVYRFPNSGTQKITIPLAARG